MLPYELVTPANIDTVIGELAYASYVALDTETTSLDPDVAKLCCISFCMGGTAYVAIAQHSREELVLSRPDLLRLCMAILRVGSSNKGQVLPSGKIRDYGAMVFFNFNYDYRILRNTIPELPWRELGMAEMRVVDAQGLVFLSDTNIFNWSLKSAARFFLGVEPPEFDESAWYGEAVFMSDPKDLIY